MDTYALRKTESEFALKRLNSSFEYKHRLERFFADNPEYALLENKKRTIASDRLIEKSEKERCLSDINRQMEDYLNKNNLSLPTQKHSCPICNDSGCVGNGYCSCFSRRLTEIVLSEDLLFDENASFDTFDETVFDEKDRKKMADIKNYCYEYANRFPDVKRPNLIFTGGTGTGKTFLLSCIALELKKKGVTTVYITSGRLFDILRQYAFNKISDIDLLLNADVLIIDDLGTEPIFNNITQEYIFMLINERTRAKKALCVSTNLSPDDVKQRYTERVSSRLFDRSRSAVLKFADTDLRLKQL